MHKGFNLPRRLDVIFGIAAFSVEGLLFAFHLHSRAPLDIQLHTLLTYAIFGCVLACCLEFYNPEQVLFTYARVLFTMLQGTWFWHIGFVLYTPDLVASIFKWNRCDHNHVSLTTVLFCWHLMLILIFLVGQLFFVQLMYKFKSAEWDELIYIDEANFQRNESRSRVTSESEVRFLRLESESEKEEEEADEETVQFDAHRMAKFKPGQHK
jgi:hypothetical protein